MSEQEEDGMSNCTVANATKRKYLNIFCTKEEIDSIQLIQNKIACASQAARPDSIPDNVSEQKSRLYIQVAIDSLASYKWLEQDWWNRMKETYSLPKEKEIWIDFNSKEFYTLL